MLVSPAPPNFGLLVIYQFFYDSFPLDQSGGTWSPRKSSSNCYRINNTTSTSSSTSNDVVNLNSSYHLSSQQKSKTLNALLTNRQQSVEEDFQNFQKTHQRKTLERSGNLEKRSFGDEDKSELDGR